MSFDGMLPIRSTYHIYQSHLSTYLSIHLSIHQFYLPFYLYFCLSTFLCIYLSINSIYVSIHLSIFLLIHLTMYLSIFHILTVHLSIHLSIWMYLSKWSPHIIQLCFFIYHIYLSITSIYKSHIFIVITSIHLSMYPSIYLSIISIHPSYHIYLCIYLDILEQMIISSYIHLFYIYWFNFVSISTTSIYPSINHIYLSITSNHHDTHKNLFYIFFD